MILRDSRIRSNAEADYCEAVRREKEDSYANSCPAFVEIKEPPVQEALCFFWSIFSAHRRLVSRPTSVSYNRYALSRNLCTSFAPNRLPGLHQNAFLNKIFTSLKLRS